MGRGRLMADVYTFIAEQGLITTDAGAILENVSNEYKNTFGQDLVVPDSTNPEGASTPQGLLIVTETLVLKTCSCSYSSISDGV